MKISLETLAALDAVARHGSFSAAAEALHKVPSALTYTMQKLEQQLGVAVFDRSGYRAKLTQMGEVLLRDGRKLLHAAESLERRLSLRVEGWEDELRIALGGLTAIDPLIPLIQAFDGLGTGTRLSFSREIFNGTWDALLDERVDLLIGAPMHAVPDGCAYREMGRMDMLLLMAPSHPLAGEPEPLSREQLRRHRLISIGDTARNMRGRAAGMEEGQELMLVYSNSAKLSLTLAGLGICYMPRERVRDHLEAGTLVARQVESPRLMPASCFAWRHREGKALQWFIEHLEPWAARHGARQERDGYAG
ncbi:LysR family transcriptional regulator [Chromobacterium phragmitis]|uniref:LysR family transcriptional regulator n=1 Tax=Chromobacterium phragmitis TaxID=2202141 RepID=A0A344UCA4_9NEIS|nr:LysR substrate-binding domain-containing protein [Chromobacterium phragmitis]AXE31495.1 LysR family transcriptional regulator [Chromobacterium phragmitis]AXE32902.1 LysR family transcriptional regulator [Chromobacterium phragmitis]